MDLMEDLLKFLKVKEIGNLMQISKTFYYSIKKNPNCLESFYLKYLKECKTKIQKLENLDTGLEYRVKNEEIHSLFNK